MALVQGYLREGRTGCSSTGLQGPAQAHGQLERQQQQGGTARDHDVGPRRWLHRGFLGV